MTFRALALLVLLAGAALLAAVLALIGETPDAGREALHLRALKERRQAPGALSAWTTADFVALPHGRPLAEYAAYERRGVALVGWVQRTLLANDGDMHLEIADAPRRSGGPDTAYVTAEIAPGWRTGRWSYERLARVFRPNAGQVTPWDTGPQKVRVSGWLLYDYAYDRVPSPRSIAHFAPRLTGWEIHPVTRIERWSERDSAWIEVPR